MHFRILSEIGDAGAGLCTGLQQPIGDLARPQIQLAVGCAPLVTGHRERMRAYAGLVARQIRNGIDGQGTHRLL